MARFTVWIVQPLLDTTPQCLLEVATGVAYSLRQLGHEVGFDPGRSAYVENPLPFADGKYGRLIVFNANRLPAMPIPEDAIIYNAEQVQTEGEWGATWQSSSYLKLMRRHLVWDYSETNTETLRSLGVDRVALCPVGFYPGLQNIVPTPTEDLDVLFIGSTNDRRVKILKDISMNRLSVRALFGVYGEERNRWIARAKIVLNMHYYPQPIFEIFRVSHLLANRKCVVSENGGRDPVLEDLAARTTAYAPYEKLVETCVALARDDAKRRRIAADGLELFQSIDQVEKVRLALEVSA